MLLLISKHNRTRNYCRYLFVEFSHGAVERFDVFMWILSSSHFNRFTQFTHIGNYCTYLIRCLLNFHTLLSINKSFVMDLSKVNPNISVLACARNYSY